GENRFTVAVEIPETIALGEAEIVLIRPQKQRLGTNVDQYEIIELETERPIQLAPVCLEHILAAQESGDSLSVLNVSSTESVIQGSNSSDLLTAKIPVGTPDAVDKPVEVAATHNGTRAYVPLAQSGRVALVDLMTLRQVDTNPLTTGEIDPIDLPANAAPGAIAIHPTDKYAYIADSNSGAVYVLDIDPLSDAYNQVTETISLASATSGVAGIELSPDGRKLFVAAPGFPNSQIIVINTDLADRPSDESANTRLWHEPIGEISVPAWVQGITVAENSQQIAFTTVSDRYGFGAVEITNDDPLLFATREPKYASLSLGSFADYFDINRAVDVEVMADGDYAFVAAINNSSQTNVESIDGRRAGSNIGIIKDPFGPEPTLVAATRPIPGGLTTDLELSRGDRYLWASYPGLKLDSTEQGALLGFNVEEIVKAVENPGNFYLDSKQ
uniref:YncE family protein n=1 Tax=Oscillatoria sp. HE19RPO TaxID=2954806 RepID=UPI0020C2C6F2